MSLVDRINDDLKTAMKAQEALRLSTLRMVKSALHLKEVDNRGPISDEQAIDVLGTLAKQRRDSITEFEKGNRKDLADKERAEMAIIAEYLPQAPDEATLKRVIDEVVTELGATSPKQMGQVITAVMGKFKGAPVDGKQVAGLVKARLTPS